MSLRADTTSLIAGRLVASLYPGHGIRGDAIPSTGTHGVPPLYNDVSLPAEAADEFRWVIVSHTFPAGTFTPYEDGSFDVIGAADGTYTITYTGYKNGASYGTATATVTIGASSTTTINAGVGAAVAAGAAAQIVLHTTVAAGVGDATASGHPAALALHTVIAASVGDATAAGHPATIDAVGPITINAGVGNAVAQGHPATINIATPLQINAGVGAAVAQGHSASIIVYGEPGTIHGRGRRKSAAQRPADDPLLEQVREKWNAIEKARASKRPADEPAADSAPPPRTTLDDGAPLPVAATPLPPGMGPAMPAQFGASPADDIGAQALASRRADEAAIVALLAQLI